MRAARLQAHAQPPVLVEAPTPARPAGHTLVGVTAVPITPLDILCATGNSYFGAPSLPYVPGVQGVGVVVESDRLAVGTHIWFPTTAGMKPGDGSLAEFAIASDEDLIALPAGVQDELVAAIGLSGVAAWMCLTSRGRLSSGESVMVLGAGGVVGQVAVQLARLLGAGRVVAAARSQNSRELALGYGADAVVELGPDDDVAGLAESMAHACKGTVDLVIDPLCGTPGSAAIRTLGPGGRVVNLGGSAGPAAQFESATLRSRSASVLGYTNNSLTADQRREALSALLAHAVTGALTVSHEVVPWHDVPDGWARQAAGTTRSRVIVGV